MILAAALVAICATPSADPSPTALKVIERVTVSATCSTLRREIAQSIEGLRVNDGLLSQGQLMMTKIRSDAMADPRSNSGAGGAGASSELDDVQMTQLVHVLAANLEKIDALLSNPRAFPDRPATADQQALATANQRLEDVAAEQRRALNLLSATSSTNAAMDLASKCDPVDCPTGGPTAIRVSLPKQRALEFKLSNRQRCG
jgi:hypothetical protein